MIKTLEAARLKQFEEANDYKVLGGLPIVFRIDGRSFSKFTKDFNKPYDTLMANAMVCTTVSLCEKIPGVKIGYTQSDEITLVVNNPGSPVEAFFNNRIQKMVSTVAAMATITFYRYFNKFMGDNDVYKKAIDNDITFDCRVFNLPSMDDVYKILEWRQHDCGVNAINGAARTILSHKEAAGKSCNELREIIADHNNESFDSYYPWQFRLGIFVIKQPRTFISEYDGSTVTRMKFNILDRPIRLPEDIKELEYDDNSI